MAVVFAGGSTQYNTNAAPPTFAYPFTVGLWHRFSSVGTTSVAWSWGDTGSATEFFRIIQVSAGTVRIDANTGATLAPMSLAGSSTQWIFVLARFISATNRRGAVLINSIGVTHGSSATNVTPTGLDTMALGAQVVNTVSLPFSGSIAEFWWADSDVFPGGIAATDSFVRQLAYGGPFSMPHIVPNLVEYHSFRASNDAPGGNGPDTWFGKYGAQNWVNTNGSANGVHFPLPRWYARHPSGQRSLRAGLAEALVGIAVAPNTSRRRRLMIIG